MRSIDTKFITLAEKISTSSQVHYQHGAVLVKDKAIVSIGVNRAIGFDKVLTRYGMLYSLHAEMDAIRKEWNIPSNSTLYVARHRFKLSKPCSKCIDVIKKTNIKRVVFSADNGPEEMFL